MTSQAPLDLEAVLELAESVRGGRHHCRVVRDLYGSSNRAVILEFDDGERWVFRTPHYERTGHGLPPEWRLKLIASEVATLKFLENSIVQVPTVKDHSSTERNSTGVPYILMTHAEGQSFAEYLRHLQQTGEGDSSQATTKLMRQLGRICANLARRRFDTIGSVQEGNGVFEVGESLMPTFVSQGRHDILMHRGPFLTKKNYYNALMEAFSGHVKHLSLGHHFFRGPCPELADYPDRMTYYTALDRWNDFMAVDDKIDSSENRIQYHTAGKLIQGIVPYFSRSDDEFPDGKFPDGESSADEFHLGESPHSKFPLRHADLSSNNIFVDENGNITCIIGWEFASTVPLEQLVMPPGLPTQRHQPSRADCKAFEVGFYAAARHGKKLPRIHNIPTDVLWHYMRWVNLDTPSDYRHFEGLFGRCPEFTGPDPLAIIDASKDRKDIRATTLSLRAGERKRDEIKRDEDTYFRLTEDGEKRRRIAKTLTERFRLRPQILGPEFWMQTVDEALEDWEDCASCSSCSSWSGSSCYSQLSE